MNPDPQPSIHTRQSLLERLKNWDDSASWADFFETYWRLIFSVARRSGLNEAEAQDVVQETILAVARKMPEFHYDPAVGSFKGWLLRLTRWRITDHFRRKTYLEGGHRKPREEAMDEAALENLPDPEGVNLDSLWEEEWKTQVLEAAMKRVRERSDPHQFQLFYLHVAQGVPARDIATRLGVKLPEVYFAKYKISAAVKRELQRLERQML